MKKEKVLNKIKNGLIVSCQALEDEPLHSSYIMSKMAYAAKEGGAVGIRANSVNDIEKIKETVDLPIIGIIKKEYGNSSVYITPTFREVKQVYESGADIIAIDGTDRKRPDGISLKELIDKVKKNYPDSILMADISTLEEGINCENIGFDMVGTTLSGYTEYTKDSEVPNFKLMNQLSKKLSIPVIAEGHIWTPEELEKAYEQNIFCAVVGTAITRPREITKRFVNKIKK